MALPVALLAAAGCVAEEEPMSAEQLRDRFATLVEQTQDVAGGTFDVQDGTTPLHCDLPDGGDGRSYGFNRLGPPPDDVEAVVETVRELWEGLGYSVRETTVGPVVELATRTEDDAPIVFGASENAVGVRGESACGVPGATSESAEA